MVTSELLEPDNMLRLYASGAFPMANEDGTIKWYLPDVRAIIPLNNYNIPRSLKKVIDNSTFEIRYDYDFLSVIRNCADREETWISEDLITAYKRLYKRGYVHSVEVWQNNELVGGLYGISFRGAFFGESMFSKVPQTSKIALTYLIKRLAEQDFVLLDVQYMTPHLKMFGAIEMPFDEFEKLLKASYLRGCSFNS